MLGDYLFLPFMPPHLVWWVGLLALATLIYTAWADGRTGLVPPEPLFWVSAAVLASRVWDLKYGAIEGLLPAIIFYLLIWLINKLWRALFRRDALGMGDASWSFLATLAYGWQPVVMAWGIGAILAVIYLVLNRLFGRHRAHIYFVPYLLIGLLVALAYKAFA